MSHIYSRRDTANNQRNGFLPVRMAGMRKSNKKKVCKQKDGERNLHYPSCTARSACSQRDETHEWNKWIKFNAGVILTDEEVRQLTEAGSEIYPMKSVDADKNAYLRRDNDYVFVPAKYKESTGWLRKV